MTPETSPRDSRHPAARVVAWLETQGYTVRFHAHEWVDCLVMLGDERWRGSGLTRNAALDDALRAMFPSRAARALLSRELDAAEALERAFDVVSPPAEPVANEPAQAAALPALEIVDGGDVEHGEHGDDPFVAVHPGGPAEVSGAGSSVLEPGGSRTDGPAPDRPPVEPIWSRWPVLDPEERTRALEDLALLLDAIEDDAEELGLSSPRRQRLAFSGWMARARSFQDACRDDRAVSRRVADVAHRIQELCKLWWPGSVRALRRDATPASALEEAGLESGPRVAWIDVAEAIPELLESLIDDEEARGYDEYGWADAASGHPAPPDPNGLLAEIASTLERHTGPLSVPPNGPESAWGLFEEQGAKGLLNLARRVRWLRAWSDRGLDWAAVAGRMRFVTQHVELEVGGLVGLLDADMRPPVPWATLIGYDPAKRERQRQRRALHERLAGAALDRDALADWLRDAFPVFDTAKLASLLGSRAGLVLALEPATLEARVEEGERRGVRRRLAKLQQRLRAGDVEPAVAGAVDDGADAALGLGDGDDSPPVSHVGLLEIVRRRRAVLVSNRTDMLLRDRLVEELGFKVLDLSEGEPRRVQSLTEAVRSGSYDLVLAATGFQSHAIDGMLARACRSASVPLLRVNRARPLAVYRAVLRQFPAA